jgi:CTP synthase (UTP-ammonia lyase)
VNETSTQVAVAVVGDFDPRHVSHRATDDALPLAARAAGVPLRFEWIPTPLMTSGGAATRLDAFDAILAAPGSPYASFDGMLEAIAFARSVDRPFLGTCGGFQYTLIEWARNVLHLPGANTAEEAAPSDHVIITPVACPVSPAPGAPKLHGDLALRVNPATLLARIYSLPHGGEVRECFFCNFEVNPAYLPEFEHSGLTLSAFGKHGELRAVESPAHCFFLATLFQPQTTSAASGRPHPVLVAFLEAAWKQM